MNSNSIIVTLDSVAKFGSLNIEALASFLGRKLTLIKPGSLYLM